MVQGNKGITIASGYRGTFSSVTEVSVSESMHKSIHAQVNASQCTKIQTPLSGQVNLPSQLVTPPVTRLPHTRLSNKLIPRICFHSVPV
jgi:hypothetical protein